MESVHPTEARYFANIADTDDDPWQAPPIVCTAKCIGCGTVEQVEVDRDDGRWSRFAFRGEFVQKVYPEYTDNERSILLGHVGGVHLCDTCCG